MFNRLSASAIIYFAQTAQVNCPTGTSNETSCTGNTGLPKTPLTHTSLQTMFEIIFGIMGAVAVIVIIIGAIRLIISQGDPQAISKIRNTIIYAAVGLAVALLAEAIVSFALKSV